MPGIHLYSSNRLEILADTFADLKPQLLALNDRVFDLLPVTENNYYHPDMRGSWSIKSVLSCLVPELTYSDLGEVQDGTQAQQSYLDIIGDKISEQRKQKQRLTRYVIVFCMLLIPLLAYTQRSLLKG